MTEKRNFRENTYYHIIMLGNNRIFIFERKEDMKEFKRALRHAHLKYPFIVPSYCFMTNQYHLLIRAKKVPLG
ncbi:transposase [Jeotgalibacillus terrae]|uniref:Transposase n=1 Tax=Jeotgalibacillus terrae TaxID=587735 RepID=A0ABW5ZCZ7_9BACL|nr:transposase [Jeotgalibacillus terrae]MBM7577877.1 REP element-mobilizing transposase RayT [Jeotgalibacillus terrae]